jgi:xanthine/CO dehydrogenase XdhC/CoxF family maturation factor
VLVEPLASGSLYVEALRRSSEAHADVAPVLVATVYQHMPSGLVPDEDRIEIGARLLISDEGEVSREKLSARAAVMLESEVRTLWRGGETSGAHDYDVDDGSVKVFVETLLPPVRLVVFGAGHDALPVVELASGLGWQTEVVDPQARSVSRSRFARADRVILSRPEEAGLHVRITPRTLTLLMSHNYSHDLELLRFLLTTPARYIGVMGPRKRTERMLCELEVNKDMAHLEEADLARLYSPAGLDIGGNAPSEIALSIIAEMRAVMDGRGGGSLRERRGSIHGNPGDDEHVPLAEEQSLQVAIA